MTNATIHPTAIVDKSCSLGEDVVVGPYSIIHPGVRIGSRTVIGSHCELGVPTDLAAEPTLSIGADSLVRSHSVLYAGSTVGDALRTGHHIIIRENSNIGPGFQLGSRGDVEGDCRIGAFVRTQSDVHIGKHSQVGDFVWLFPEVLLTNDPMPPSSSVRGVRIGQFSVIASKVLLLPGVSVGAECLIAASSVVAGDIPDGMVARGNPARPLGRASILRMPDNPAERAYPWRRHFHRGYPDSIVAEWRLEFDQG